MKEKPKDEPCCVCGESTKEFYGLTVRGFICISCHRDWNERGWESRFMKGETYEKPK